MQRKNLFSGLASIVGATVLSFTGCGTKVVNHAPTLRFYENDGTIVNPTKDILEEVPSCDDVYLLSLPRGNVIQGQLDLKAVAQDEDKNDVLSTNVYPVDNDAFDVNIIEGINTNNLQESNIEINPKTNPSLGTYLIARGYTTDGIFSRNACIYMSTVPGTTGELGGIPQIPGGNGGNGDMTCHSDNDCDMHEICVDGSCVVHQPEEQSLLEKAVLWSCENLHRSNDTNILLYKVTPMNNGATFTSREIMELAPGHPEASTLYEIVKAGPTSSFYVAAGGNTPSGQTVGETIRGEIGYDDNRNPNAKTYGNVAGGYTPTNCDGLYFINSNPSNPTPQSVPNGVFTVFSTGD